LAESVWCEAREYVVRETLLAESSLTRHTHTHTNKHTQTPEELSGASHQPPEAAVCSVRIHRCMHLVGGMRHAFKACFEDMLLKHALRE
jgi:hypothetical protein